ncbi:MAG: DEAD/DEAH box helicase [Bacteroidia bacterium]
MTFEQLGLRTELLKAIQDLGFQSPTPIQEKAIPELLKEPRDLVGLAQTGTGKTAAFGLPMLSLLDFNEKHTQGLVIAPTRELCLQICEDFKSYSKHIKGANMVAIYGGASIDRQAGEIRRGAQVICATPGRLADMIRQRIVDLRRVQIVVLDEADEMLNMGFKEELDAILETTPDTKNTWLFSATMPKEVASIAKNYMSNPFEVTVGQKNVGNENIQHTYFVVRDKDRYHTLKRIIDLHPNLFGLVFCRTKRETQTVADNLMRDGYNAEPLHGDLSQMQRDFVMKKFRDRTLQILVATDVAARGIDVDDITHVINYNLPDETENYTHRSGRTARAGKLGESIILINTKELYKIKALERQINKEFKKALIPSGDEICYIQLMSLIEKIKSTKVNEDDIESFFPAIVEQFSDMSKEDLLKRFVYVEFSRFIQYYKGSKDLNADVRNEKSDRRGDRDDRRDRGDRDERGGGRDREKSRFDDETKVRFYINRGELDNLNKGALVRLICDSADITSKQIGRIDIKREFSFVEVDKDIEKKVFEGLKGTQFDGKDVRVEYPGVRNSSPREGAPKRDFSPKHKSFNKGGDRSRREGGRDGDRKKFKRR